MVMYIVFTVHALIIISLTNIFYFIYKESYKEDLPPQFLLDIDTKLAEKAGDVNSLKISKAKKAKLLSDEHNAKLSKAKKGKPLPDEHMGGSARQRRESHSRTNTSQRLAGH